MAYPVGSGSGLFKHLRPNRRLQSTYIQAVALWGVAATTTALWLIQAFRLVEKDTF